MFKNNNNYPSIVKNKIIDWPILKWDKHKWCEIFGSKKLVFRGGDTTARDSPQWESQCYSTELTMLEFWTQSETENNNTWLYFDYKDMKTAVENADILQATSWAALGYPELTGSDSSLWIGNKGAHTPCHVDTYGYNLVAQVYGRKLWFLVPPEESEKMHPTRVPYEESSIYSALNFLTPKSDILKIEKCYKLELEPGDVLYVPRHWWHFVQNLDIAVSVNTWIPQEEDCEARLEEGLVQRIVHTLAQDLPLQQAKLLLNPNEYRLLQEPPDNELIATAAEQVLESRKKRRETNNMNKKRRFENSFMKEGVSDSNESVNSKKNRGICSQGEFVHEDARDTIESVKEKGNAENETIERVSEMPVVTESDLKDHKEDKINNATEKTYAVLKPLSTAALVQFLEEKGKKYNYDPYSKRKPLKEDKDFAVIKTIINSFCQPNSVQLAKENFLRLMEPDLD